MPPIVKSLHIRPIDYNWKRLRRVTTNRLRSSRVQPGGAELAALPFG
jgi:hypothetical protein